MSVSISSYFDSSIGRDLASILQPFHLGNWESIYFDGKDKSCSFVDNRVLKFADDLRFTYRRKNIFCPYTSLNILLTINSQFRAALNVAMFVYNFTRIFSCQFTGDFFNHQCQTIFFLDFSILCALFTDLHFIQEPK